jgi:hypothetical protein
MKKPLFLLFACLPFSSVLWADPVGWGVRGGANMATQVNSSLAGQGDVIFGLTGCVFIDLKLNDQLYFQPEVEYSMKGVQLTFKDFLYKGQIINPVFTYNYNYLEIPLLLKIQAEATESLILNFFLGPSPAFLLETNAHNSVNSGGDALNGMPLEGTNFDLGGTVGVGLEIDHFLLDLRYDLGLLSVVPNNSTGPTNSVLSLTAGYRFQ